MRLTEWVRQLQADGRDVLLCGDVNIARTEMDVHPKERKPGTVGHCRRSGRCSRPFLAPGFPTSGGKWTLKRRPVHLVGTLAKPPRPEHRLEAGLPACVTRRGHSSPKLRGTGRCRHQ